jgi:NAD(P)H-hydrate epimerase
VKLVTADEMRSLEEMAAKQGRTPDVLMEEAGLAVAQEVWVNLGAVAERKVVVLVGPGNNGGDGLVAARHMHEFGAEVVVLLLAERGEDDANLRELVERDIAVHAIDESNMSEADAALGGADAIVDAIIGTGRARPIEGVIADALERAREAKAGPLRPKVFAVDLPTGVDADSGAADPLALSADITVALGCSKVGLHTLPGAEYAGNVEVVDIGLPAEAVDELPVELLNARRVREHLPARPASANKGTFGRVLVVAGSKLYAGAARLAALGALRSGAGLVTIACPTSVQALIAPGVSEATYLPVAERDGFVAGEAVVEVARAMRSYDVLLIGPGLGQGVGQDALIRQLLSEISSDGPRVVVDADGLNALARTPHWWERTEANCVLTPHPGEFARLTGRAVDDIQGDRLLVARSATATWKQTVVLKGAYSVVASPGGTAAVNPYANPALASAGTGDVLAGAIAGLLAQGLSPFDASCCAAYLHTAAAEGLRSEFGDAGMLAGDLLIELPRTVKELRGIS